MQKPINSAERNSAFRKFLFFFILCILMVITAVYFDVKFPFKENELLKEKSEQIRLDAMAQEKFTSNMLEAKALIDSMDKPGVNVKYLSDRVTDKLSDLTKMQIADSSLQGRMNKAILSVYLDYNKIKSSMTSLADAQAQIADLSSKNGELTKERDQLRRDIDLFNKTGPR
jgi:hypothetical protein